MKALYDHALHHPGVTYIVGLALLFAIVARLPFLYSYLIIFLVTILADATVTGAWSPVPIDSGAYTALSVVFIILGDLRYFLLAERVTRPSEPLWRTLLFSAPITMVMPITTGILTRTVDFMADTRVLYIVYESAMGVMVLSLQYLRFSKRSVDLEVHRWVREVSWLFAGLYFGWALSDVIILAGFDFGHLLRIIPNVLYYGAFLVVVFWRAPASMKALR